MNYQKKQAVTGSLEQMNILVVEDSPEGRVLSRILLTKMEQNVQTVDNGLSALETLSRKDFDLIFMDIRMPVMDGVQTANIIRSLESGQLPPMDDPKNIFPTLRKRLKGKHLSIVAMTALDLNDEEEINLSVAMDDYLVKPIQPKELEVILKKHQPLLDRNGEYLQNEKSVEDRDDVTTVDEYASR